MAEALVCVSCGRDLDVCYFCDREDCPSAGCYRCVVVELHECVPQPHGHGG